jgi:hypothetical protein
VIGEGGGERRSRGVRGISSLDILAIEGEPYTNSTNLLKLASTLGTTLAAGLERILDTSIGLIIIRLASRIIRVSTSASDSIGSITTRPSARTIRPRTSLTTRIGVELT